MTETLKNLTLNADGSLSGPGTEKAVVEVPRARTEDAQETTYFGLVRARWTSSSRVTFPTAGAGYHRFENEVMAAATGADQTAVVDKWVRVYRGQHDGVTAGAITQHRTRLEAFVTSYNASYP